MKYLLLVLSVYSYGIGFMFASNPNNDHPATSMLIGGFLGTILMIGSLVLLIGEEK